MADKILLTFKNYKKYQHYKNRNPPWIKLHRKLLGDMEFMSLSYASRGLLMLLWALAAEFDGQIEATEGQIGFWLHDTNFSIEKIKPLISTGFVILQASDSILQADDNKKCSESETDNSETDNSETDNSETETEADLAFEIFWDNYPSRNGKKLEKTATKAAFKKLSEEDQAAIAEAAKNYSNSQRVKDGIGVKDPKRFIKDGKGNEPWRDWETPEDGIWNIYNPDIGGSEDG